MTQLSLSLPPEMEPRAGARRRDALAHGRTCLGAIPDLHVSTTNRGDHAGPPRPETKPYWARSSDTSIASVQTMSTLSPTFTLARASVSCTLDVYFNPLGPVNVIDGTAVSIAEIVAVIVVCLALVPPGRVCSEPVVPVTWLIVSGSPGCFSRRMTFS